jgi:hypothetical protein
MYTRVLASLSVVALLSQFGTASPYGNALQARQDPSNVVYVTDADTFWYVIRNLG